MSPPAITVNALAMVLNGRSMLPSLRAASLPVVATYQVRAADAGSTSTAASRHPTTTAHSVLPLRPMVGLISVVASSFAVTVSARTIGSPHP